MKGQISMFIIIGIILLAAVAVSASLIGYKTWENNNQLVFDRSSISHYVEQCLTEVSAEAIQKIGDRGGRIIPNKSVQTPTDRIGIITVDNLPSKEDAKSDIETYIEENINRKCLRDLHIFEDKGWEVNAGELKAYAELNLETVQITAEMPVEVSYEGSTITLERFITTHPVRLGYIIDAASKAAELHHQNSGWIDAENPDYTLQYTIFPYKKMLIYHIRDTESMLKAEEYTFRFAAG